MLRRNILLRLLRFSHFANQTKTVPPIGLARRYLFSLGLHRPLAGKFAAALVDTDPRTPTPAPFVFGVRDHRGCFRARAYRRSVQFATVCQPHEQRNISEIGFGCGRWCCDS